MTEKKLHEKTINELLDDEMSGISEYKDAMLAICVLKEEVLKKWAIAVVKQRKEIWGNISMDDISLFLISRFELTKCDVNG